MLLPPALSGNDFTNLAGTKDGAATHVRFARIVNGMREFLNELPCIAMVQPIRGARPNQRTFDERNDHYHPQHWYTYHRGGRSEAQFNVGMFGTHLRMGIGFEPTGAMHGDPAQVHAAMRKFAEALRNAPDGAEDFARTQRLEVEFDAPGRGVDHDGVKRFLTEADAGTPSVRWIFVGRILRIDRDAAMLKDRYALAVEMERTFATLWPFWRATR